MKILYIAHERRAAQLAARALRDVAPNGTLTWASTLPAARRWVEHNRDAAAVIVEADVHGEGCASFVDHVRGLGLATAIVAVAAEPAGAPLDALNARGDVLVVDGRALEADLPRILTGVLQRTRAAAATTRQSEMAPRANGDRESTSGEVLEATCGAEIEERVAQEVAKRTEQHNASLARAARLCAALQQRLGELETALRNADERRASEAAASADHIAQRHTAFTASLERVARQRDEVAQKLSVAVAALDETRQARTSEAAAAAERLARREAELSATLAEAESARVAVEQRLAEAEAEHQHARERAAADLAAAAERAREVAQQLDRESGIRAALDRDLAESRMTSAQARRRLLEAASALRRRTREHRAQLESQLERERTHSARSIEARDDEIRQLQLERTTLQRSLVTAQEQLERLNSSLEEERQDHDHLRQSLDRVQAAFHTLEQVAGEHAIERARLESVVADRDAELSAQAARHATAQHAAEDSLQQIQERLRLALEAGSSDSARLQRDVDTLRHELEAARAQADSLRSTAARVPGLETQLEQSLRENLRQFERAPYGLCRFTRDGALTHVNHALVRLLGYRKVDDLRRIDFAAAVFDCEGDLRWLIEQSVSNGTTESMEAAWRTKDRGRLLVRLHALTTTDGSVEVVVEDITSLRAVEERLRHAQRMEAVGRLASEVAVTCDTLLRDVTEDGQQWLATIGSDNPVRRQGELLLGEVTRAAGFLRQFGVYGNGQITALEPVSVPRVLRDLEPVLKRLAGDDIELLLPKTSGPFDVDVEAERVERILVNVASYARQRMPQGGRVKIDLALTMVDRRFIARYPGVRPGAHVLITVSEIRGAVRPGLPGELRKESVSADARPASSNKLGVDLGALLALIGDCGGHLWMEAEPSGNMTLRIRLPKRLPEDGKDSAVPGGRSGRRQFARWFRNNQRSDPRSRSTVP